MDNNNLTAGKTNLLFQNRSVAAKYRVNLTFCRAPNTLNFV